VLSFCSGKPRSSRNSSTVAQSTKVIQPSLFRAKISRLSSMICKICCRSRVSISSCSKNAIIISPRRDPSPTWDDIVRIARERADQLGAPAIGEWNLLPARQLLPGPPLETAGRLLSVVGRARSMAIAQGVRGLSHGLGRSNLRPLRSRLSESVNFAFMW
jgi:hypothetical protein